MALSPTEEAQTRDLIAQQAALLSLAGVEPTILSKLGATKVTLSDLPTASAINDADLLLLRQGTTDKSVTGLTFKKLIPTVADASTTVKGVVELATDAETQTGTDSVRAITPSNLSSRTATETRTGVVELATDAEAQAFTADKFIDGAKLNTAFKGSNQSLATSGYQKLPGGLILQWLGIPESNTQAAVVGTYPIAFPNGFLSACVGSTNTTSSSNSDMYCQFVSSTLSQVTVYRQGVNNFANTGGIVFALGY